ncbi:hypothetical protein R6Q59_023384 [Mikania micrantha]
MNPNAGDSISSVAVTASWYSELALWLARLIRSEGTLQSKKADELSIVQYTLTDLCFTCLFSFTFDALSFYAVVYMSVFEEELDPFRIPLADLKTATNDFAEENLLKRGENSAVYIGKLQLGSKVRDVVIRKFSSNSFIFNLLLYKRIEIISGMTHKNFACFFGFWEEEGETMIVMERVVHGSLHRHLSILTCLQRLEACFDAAVALQEWGKVNCFRSDPCIDFKLLLDKDWKAKILVSIKPDKEHSDCYFLGKMLLEVLYGRKVTNEDVNQVKQGYDIIENTDPYLKKEMLPDSLSLLTEAINNCFQNSADFIHVSIPLLAEAHEIQWKRQNFVSSFISNQFLV